MAKRTYTMHETRIENVYIHEMLGNESRAEAPYRPAYMKSSTL